jgi:ketosteroid isomerase-like protein
MEPQESKALVRRLVELVNAGDLEALDEVAGQIAEAARPWIGSFRESFPDFRMEVRDLIAEATRSLATSSARAPTGVSGAATRRPGARFEDVDEIYIFRVAEGKLSATTAVVEDNLTRMRQLGIQP